MRFVMSGVHQIRTDGHEQQERQRQQSPIQQRETSRLRFDWCVRFLCELFVHDSCLVVRMSVSRAHVCFVRAACVQRSSPGCRACGLSETQERAWSDERRRCLSPACPRRCSACCSLSVGVRLSLSLSLCRASRPRLVDHRRRAPGSNTSNNRRENSVRVARGGCIGGGSSRVGHCSPAEDR